MLESGWNRNPFKCLITLTALCTYLLTEVLLDVNIKNIINLRSDQAGHGLLAFIEISSTGEIN